MLNPVTGNPKTIVVEFEQSQIVPWAGTNFVSSGTDGFHWFKLSGKKAVHGQINEIAGVLTLSECLDHCDND